MTTYSVPRCVFLFNGISLFNLLIYWLMNTRVPMACRVGEAQSRPKREYPPKPKLSFDYGQVENSNEGCTPTATSPPYYSAGNVCVQRLLPVFPACTWRSLTFLPPCDIEQPQHNVQLYPPKEPRSRADPVSETRQDAVKSRRFGHTDVHCRRAGGECVF